MSKMDLLVAATIWIKTKCYNKNISVLTQVVLETVAGLVGVGEPGVKRSSSVAFDLILNILSHYSGLGCTSKRCK